MKKKRKWPPSSAMVSINAAVADGRPTEVAKAIISIMRVPKMSPDVLMQALSTFGKVCEPPTGNTTTSINSSSFTGNLA